MTTRLQDAIHVVGQITLLWSRTEIHLERIIWAYTDAEARIGRAITGILGNVSKSDLLLALAGELEGEEEILDHLNHLVECYNICRENRNIVIHSAIVEDDDGETMLIKGTRTGRFNTFEGAIEILRDVSEEVGATYHYCKALEEHIWFPHAYGHLRHTGVVRPPLPSKPQKPRKLTPGHSPGAEQAFPHPLDTWRPKAAKGKAKPPPSPPSA